MCTGYIFKMACGHEQVGFHERCYHECKRPEGKVRSIEDACTACRPNHTITEICRHYDDLLDEQTTLYSRALRLDDHAKAREYYSNIVNLRVGRKYKINEINKDFEMDVDKPEKPTED